MRLIDADELLTAFPPGESVRTESVRATIEHMPTIQSEVIHCKDCEYGAQDEYGRWYCRDLGCQIGNEDGSGFCASAERRSK